MQVNASLSPPPVWNMDLCLCNHDGNLLYVYDKYSLIWFAWTRMLLRVWCMCILLIAALTVFCHIFWLHAMLGPWLAHCKSSWSCMNWHMSPKHLCVAQAVIPHATIIYTLTRRLEESTLRDERYVNKLFNLLCLTGCGYHDHLEKGGLVGPNMGM